MYFEEVAQESLEDHKTQVSIIEKYDEEYPGERSDAACVWPDLRISRKRKFDSFELVLAPRGKTFSCWRTKKGSRRKSGIIIPES